MQRGIGKLELLVAIGLAVVVVVALVMSGGGLRFAPKVLAGTAPQLITGNGNGSSTILSPGSGTQGMLPAGLNDIGIFKQVGIGVDPPATNRLLHIKGNICLFERNADSAGFIIHRTGGIGYNRWVVGADDATGFVIKTYPWDGASETYTKVQMVITKDNPATTTVNESKVGIGDTTPTAKLSVAADSGDAIVGNGASAGVFGIGYYGVRGSSGNGYAGYFQGDVFAGGATTVTNGLTVYNGLSVMSGVKSFVMEDPADPSKEIRYACLEGPEAGTYIRGSAELVAGEAVIELPEHFAKVTADEGLTVQLTPVGKWLQLYVVEKGTARIVVREATGQSGSFDYFVNGIRQGYEDFQVIRDRTPAPEK
jgi:hypothetical protein